MPAPPPTEYQFRPGQSGNPGGRPKGLRALLHERFGPDAKALIDPLWQIASSKKTASSDRIQAFKLLLAYHSGAPDKHVEVSGPEGSSLGPITFVIKRREPKA